MLGGVDLEEGSAGAEGVEGHEGGEGYESEEVAVVSASDAGCCQPLFIYLRPQNAELGRHRWMGGCEREGRRENVPIVQKPTMMIMRLHTNITLPTMMAPGRSPNITCPTILDRDLHRRIQQWESLHQQPARGTGRQLQRISIRPRLRKSLQVARKDSGIGNRGVHEGREGDVEDVSEHDGDSRRDVVPEPGGGEDKVDDCWDADGDCS